MIAVESFMLVFRVLHILAGVLWVGAVFLLVVFVQPSVVAIAPAGAPFMAEMLGKRRLIDWILRLAGITVIAGLFLYWRDWHQYGSFGDWISTSFGALLTVGLVAALIAMGFGAFGTRPNVRRLLALGAQVAASGGPPTPEVAAEIGTIQGRLKTFARISLTFLIIAVLAMASARYW